MAQAHAEADVGLQVVTDAVALRLAAAVDVLTNLDAAMRDRVADGAWEQMRGMRNRIARGYASVSPAIVRATVDSELEPLIQRITHLLMEIVIDE